MRAKSDLVSGYTVYAISGVNTISFAIDFRQADTAGLLGFAVERLDQQSGNRRYIKGYKVFKEIIPDPNEDTVVSTEDHPVQSFVWDDFTCKDNSRYTYWFHPIKGTPNALDRSADPIALEISTEPLFSDQEHDVFFNRGVASSQAYRIRFNNLGPKDIQDPVKKQEALDWLSRELDEAMFAFVDRCVEGDKLYCCFYEFRYRPLLDKLKLALDRRVKVKIIIDAKDNSSYDTKKQKDVEAFPWRDNIRFIEAAGIPMSAIIERKANKSNIQHNKFMVYKPIGAVAKEVWTGSTNISDGGIHGQTNVGHWVRNEAVAEKFLAYWNILSADPGAQAGDDKNTGMAKNKELKLAVEDLQPNFRYTRLEDIAEGITTVFSPRRGPDVLESYVKMLDSARSVSCITLAFGINKLFKEAVLDNDATSAVTFFLLEKEDAPTEKNKSTFVKIGYRQNVYQAFGNYLKDSLYQWAKEISPQKLGVNKHVSYIHSKFLLVDPLSSDPLVVTGSANFSTASTNSNDENMLVIRGNMRVADIYFTEYNRIFNHYYFRSVYNKVKKNAASKSQSPFLDTSGAWLEKYESGTFRYKRVMAYATMQGFG
ncbi:phospholipase D-like domain-containing protein [Pedobacter frigoris]|uniref:phospholipase D n=1 Tax=Pedobacter frigoris TaxID=2571272 RepID=A0A4U1CQ53_9SPHI|nr:phospholipase D-like domain-containing protein [Pedobacter frigoris]TKC09684.1 hypothetical protein FA047_06280 [Pedobacter frigoris]